MFFFFIPVCISNNDDARSFVIISADKSKGYPSRVVFGPVLQPIKAVRGNMTPYSVLCLPPSIFIYIYIHKKKISMGNTNDHFTCHSRGSLYKYGSDEKINKKKAKAIYTVYIYEVYGQTYTHTHESDQNTPPQSYFIGRMDRNNL